MCPGAQGDQSPTSKQRMHEFTGLKVKNRGLSSPEKHSGGIYGGFAADQWVRWSVARHCFVSISLRLTSLLDDLRPPTFEHQAPTYYFQPLGEFNNITPHSWTIFSLRFVCFAFPTASAGASGQVHSVIHPGNNYCVHINIETGKAKRVYRLAAMDGVMMPLESKWKMDGL